MQKRAEKTRGKILAAGRRLFSEMGFHGAGVDDIAALAGVNKQRIYAYFGDKSGLFESCLLDAYSDMNAGDDVLLGLDESSLPNLTETILRHYMESHRRNPDFWRLVAWANLQHEDFTARLKDVKEKSFSHLRGLYEAGRRKKIFSRDVSFESYMFALLSVSYFYFSNRRTLANMLAASFFSRTGADKLAAELSLLLGGGKPG